MEPLPSIHIYNKEEEPLQAALREVNLDETLIVGEDKPEILLQIRSQNSSDNHDNPILWCTHNGAAEQSRWVWEFGRLRYQSGLPGGACTEHY